GSSRGSVVLWEVVSGRRLNVLNSTAGTFAVAFAPDGATVASGHADGAVRLWDRDTGKERALLRGHSWVVYSLAFAPDGRSVISGSAAAPVRVWDPAACRERATFQWHTRWVTCVAFAPDGMTAAAGSADGTVVIWDVD